MLCIYSDCKQQKHKKSAWIEHKTKIKDNRLDKVIENSKDKDNKWQFDWLLVVKSNLARLIQTGVYNQGGQSSKGATGREQKAPWRSAMKERASQTILEALCDISFPLLQMIHWQRQRKRSTKGGRGGKNKSVERRGCGEESRKSRKHTVSDGGTKGWTMAQLWGAPVHGGTTASCWP